MKKFIFLFLIHIIKLDNKFYNKDLNEDCHGNLECVTACCKMDKCAENKECLLYKKLIYTLDGVFCFIFLVIVTVYMFKKLRHIKEDLNEELLNAKSNLNTKLIYEENKQNSNNINNNNNNNNNYNT